MMWGSTAPPLESATAVEWDKASLCSHPLYSAPPPCSQDGSSLLQGHTTQKTRQLKISTNSEHDRWRYPQTRIVLTYSSRTHFIPPTYVLWLVHQPKNVQHLYPFFHLDKRSRWKTCQTTCEKKKGNFFQGRKPEKVKPMLQPLAETFTWLLRPPVITFSMKQRLGITVKWAGLCRVITLRLII